MRNSHRLVLGLALLLGATITPVQAQATSPFVGQLMLVGYDTCPQGWAEADGQLLSISANTALFSLYTTTYGGNGSTNFALPDLRGRAPIHHGPGPGLTSRDPGDSYGSETHTHTASTSVSATSDEPARRGGSLDPSSGTVDAPQSFSGSTSVSPSASEGPRLAMTWCVALTGVYPSF